MHQKKPHIPDIGFAFKIIALLVVLGLGAFLETTTNSGITIPDREPYYEIQQDPVDNRNKHVPSESIKA